MTVTSGINDDKPGYILQALADALETDIKEHLNECAIEIPESYGTGSIRLLTFSHGISLIALTCKLKKDFELVYNDGMVHPLKIILVKDGSLKHAFNQGEKTNTINCYESILVASTPDNNHTFNIPRNKIISFLSIQINRKKFEEKIQDFIPYMHKDLALIFRDVNGIKEFFHKNFYAPESLKLIEDIFSKSGQNFIESVAIEGQTYQLMVSQLNSYLVNLKSINPINSVASKTRIKINEAVSFIENHLSDYTTVKDLAKKININPKTLQIGFKQYFNCTVNIYVRNFRANKARMLVETSELSVSEIAYKIGFSSPNHLSKLFRLYYGLSPTEYRNKIKKES